MNYYSLNNSLNTTIAGEHPQFEEAIYHCDVWQEPKFVDRVTFVKTDFEPIIANAVLRKKAKVTDLISGGIIGFSLKLLISAKLKSIIEHRQTLGLQFYKSPLILANEKIEDFWLVNPYIFDMHFIDFDKSRVSQRIRKPEGGTYLSTIAFNSIDEFNTKLVSENLEGKLYIDKIVVKHNVVQDFFVLKNVEGGVKYIVSEKLKQEIEDAGCTGIEFQPSELSLNEWYHDGHREKIYGKT